MVVDALRQKLVSNESLALLEVSKHPLVREVYYLANSFLRLKKTRKKTMLEYIKVSLYSIIK